MNLVRVSPQIQKEKLCVQLGGLTTRWGHSETGVMEPGWSGKASGRRWPLRRRKIATGRNLFFGSMNFVIKPRNQANHESEIVAGFLKHSVYCFSLFPAPGTSLVFSADNSPLNTVWISTTFFPTDCELRPLIGGCTREYTHTYTHTHTSVERRCQANGHFIQVFRLYFPRL